MKTLVVYSTRTGNTKKIAEAVAEAVGPCAMFAVDDAPLPDAYDFICAGYWVDKGMPDEGCTRYLESVKGKKVALFGTLGAYPDSDHARECIEKSEHLVREGGNTVLGSFMCQGKIDPALLAAMQKMPGNPHPMTPERAARIEAAKSHPDEQDCANARTMFTSFLAAARG